MEKLQKALQKAREQRAGVMASKEATAGTLPDRAGGTDKANLWANLPEIELSTPRLERNRIVTTKPSKLATPFDILRTKIMLTMRSNGWTRLAITSPTASCGKTTAAINIALGFSRQTDTSAMLFEFDLRRPAIARTLDLPPAPDIDRMLLGEVPFSEQAQRYQSNVAISATRNRLTDPASTLLSTAAQQTLARIDQAYEPTVMIFDLPPLLVSEDTRAVLKETDCALMVVRAESTTMAQIDSCEREISDQTNMLGIMLNQCQHVEEIFSYESYDAAS